MSNSYRVVMTCWDENCPPYADSIPAAFSSYPFAKEVIDDHVTQKLEKLKETGLQFAVEKNVGHNALVKKRVGDGYVPVVAYDIYEVEGITCEFPWWKYRGYNITSDGTGSQYVVENYNGVVIAKEPSIELALMTIDRDVLAKELA